MEDVLIEEKIVISPTETMPMLWRNYAFTKDGKSWRSEKTHPTRESAKESIASNEKLLNFGPRNFSSLDGVFAKADYHYAMPMPELV